MGYVGATLTPLFDADPSERALRRMARRGADRMLDYVVANSPIDSGNLRTSWRTKALRIEVRAGRWAYATGVETDVDYAPFVEHGTGKWGPTGMPYVIEPKHPGGSLRFQPRTGGVVQSGLGAGQPEVGGFIYRKRVLHPGSPGQHMLATAVAMTEATLNATMEPELRRWKAEQEALAAKAQAGARR